MGLILVTGPAGPPVTMEALRGHLNLIALGSPPSHPQDSDAKRYLMAALSSIEGPEGWLGRVLVTQTWRYTLDCFPARAGVIDVPLPPLQTIESVEYFDRDNQAQTFNPTLYQVDSSVAPARLAPVDGAVWPATAKRFEAVQIIFVAGYKAISSPVTDYGETVPDAIKQGLLLTTGTWFQNREDAVIGSSTNGLPPENAKSLMFRYRLECNR